MSDTKVDSEQGISQLSGSQESFEYTDEEARRAVRKLDYAILPAMTMFYLLSFLDRANIGNARVAGLQRDLHMSDHQYSIVVTILYVPYILAELPSNLLLRKVGPRLLMPTLLTVWGVIVTLQGLVTSYPGLVVARAILGAIEGPMFPGIVLYLSGFYTRKELALRVAVFFSSASLSGAFSGLLAAAIVNMDGIGGKPGWAWIFILEGIFSVLMGVLGFFVVPSTPREVITLNDKEKELIIDRLQKDRPSMNPADRFSLREVIRSLTSPHVLLVFAMFYMLGTNLYGLALFLPSIVNQLGFDANQSQLLSVGPFAAGFFVTLLSAFWSDKFNKRAVPTAMIYTLSVIGFAMYLGTNDKWTRYGSLFFAVPGVYSAAPVVSAWMSNNSEGHFRRATSIAFGFIATNSGGITSTWLYPTNEAPKFKRATIINLVFAISVLVLTAINSLMLARANKSKKQKRDELLAPYVDEKTGQIDEMRAWADLGDKHPDFVYTI
ncbi:MFS general substrate transporter [Dendrothele bispora CBS 962.96]|uniref:MFS general substrate transporter n=1 Tax=Dendrothele bispora (strain CBS 962.96) TaxID=1314807 RepID=A0A4S8MXE4_DENBC|nr:MFS general substrate transporter [Dendrothele bispora CBS 962.96]